jgi:hypothetical protein
MTVKELMEQVDIDRVTDAFILIDYFFSVDNYENTFIEKYKAVADFREMIRTNIRLFAECTPDDGIEPHTIFIIETTDGEDYEKQWKKRLSAFAICDEEALSVIDKDFRIFDHEGKVQITHYAFEHVPMQEMTNYVIARSSLDEFGKEICAAKILSEMFFWGALPEDRGKKVNEFHEKVSKPIDEKRLVDSKSLEEIMRECDERLMADMSKDEKAYHLAKEHFEKETEDILHRYWHRVTEEIHEQYIEAIKAEYKRR